MSTQRNNIARLVEDAIELDQRIQADTERLKGLKADLVALAVEEDPARRTPTDGGGWSLTFEGRDGAIARVTQPGAKLKSTVDFESKAGAKLKEKLGAGWQTLFRPVLKYAPLEDFRERVADTLKPVEARAVLKAVTTESAPTVSFETKEKA